MQQRLRIAIVGGGAIGGYVAAYLSRAGQDVVVIDAWPEHVERIRSHGITIDELVDGGSVQVPLQALHISDVPQLVRQPAFDIALVAVKSYDTAWATTLITPYLAAHGVVASMQNGWNDATVASVAGWPRTLAVVAARVAVELIEPGRIQRTVARGTADKPAFRVGEPSGQITPRVQQLHGLISLVDSTRLTSNLWGERWTKLCVNAMRNSLAAVTGLGGNDIDRDPIARAFGIRLGGEAVEVGLAQGYHLETVYNLDPDALARAHAGDAAALAEVNEVLLASTRQDRDDRQRPSMGQDIRKGRRTEIEWINQIVVQYGQNFGVATPANAAVVDWVRRIERGQLQPSLSLLETF